MNRPESNPLQQELARGRTTGHHPDEDVLTAFAENALLERERGKVMEHLCACAQCREVLSLVTATTPEAVVPHKAHTLPVRPPLRGWLPWVAAAAGLAVISSAVVLHERTTGRQQPASPTADVAKVEAVPPPQLPQPAPLQQLQETPAPPAKPGQASQIAKPRIQANAIKKAARSEEQTAGMGQEAYGNLPAAAGRSADRKVISGPITTDAESLEVASAPAAPPQPPQIANQDESVQAANSAQAKSKTVPAVGRAAPAPAFAAGAAGLTAGFSGMAARAHWRISDTGQAERSIGNGAWQPVLTDEKTRMRVVSVFGRNVWVGGEPLRLYHSDNDGATWHLVLLPNKGSGTHAVTHVRFQTDQAGTVEADDGTQWSTVDGGQTWR